MKKRNLILFLCLIIIALLVWRAWPPRSNEQRSETLEPISAEKKQATPKPKQTLSDTRQNKFPSRPANLDPSVTEADWEYYQKNKADPLYDWKQPINFYGRVVDENEQAVEGASADFKWTDLSSNGNSEYHTVSDASGLFFMLNQKGKRLSVTASKPGYYSAADARLASFEYANPADGLFTPDPRNPVVFHLRKKGTGTDLITSQYGMKPHFGVTVPLDGTSVQVDLLERKTGASGQLKVSQIKPPSKEWKQATEWSFRMEIPDGGFVEYNDEFPFEAPERGYASVIEFQFRKGETNWVEGIKKDFYIKFGNPSRYGRLHLDTLIEMGGARFTYAINPDGSRNLEYDEKVRPKPTHFE